MNYAHGLHIILVIGKYTDGFQGEYFSGGGRGLWGEGYLGGSFHGGISHGGREFSIIGPPDCPALFK